MEKFTYSFPATKKIERPAHVGVVGSGDLEVLVEPINEDKVIFEIRTGVVGFQETWKKVIERFVNRNPFSARITINDFGATPGIVSLRLAQAMEESMNGESDVK